MNFDLGLAKEQSQKNPVFYVQYAYARICSIIRKAQETMTKIQDTKNINMKLLIHEKELSLIKEINKFPELIEEISQCYEVHKLPHYAIRLADKFHSFYDACRVIDEGNPQLSKARLTLTNAAKIVLAETLNLIGVSTPEKM
jgi:arginyl-tRNA synthetase